MDKVVHFEIPVTNVDRAKKFYQEAFEWFMEDVPGMNYIVVKTAKTENDEMPKDCGINGGMVPRADQNNVLQGASLTIQVNDIEEAMKRIKNAGGLIVKEKTLIQNIGYVCYFKDTEQNILGIWQTI